MTRLVHPRRRLAVQAVWAAVMLLNTLLIVWTLADYGTLRRGSAIRVIGRVYEEDGLVRLRAPSGDNPAGIQEGDVVVAIDGLPLAPGTTARQAADRIQRGEMGSTVTLTLRRGDGPPFDVPVTLVSAYYPKVQGALEFGLPLNAVVLFMTLLDGGVMLVSLAVALFIAWRRADDWMALFAALTITAINLGFAFTDSPVFLSTPLINGVYAPLMLGAAILFGLLFPDGRFRPRWAWLIVAAYFPLRFVTVFGNIPVTPASGLLTAAAYLTVVTTVIGVVVYRYRHVFSRVQRQQTKWIVFGVGVAVLLGQLYYSVPDLLPVSTDVALRINFVGYIIAHSALLLIPLTFAFGVLRYRLYDIDLVINRGLVSLLVTVGLAGVFALVFLGAHAVLTAALSGYSEGVAIAVSAAAAAALFNPARRRVRHFIDRRLYGFRFDLNQVAAAQKPASAHNPGLLTGQRLGEYQVLGVLGRGGMGEVYQGQADDGRLVALKTLPADLADQPTARKRFEREAAALATLHHPNIVRFYSAGANGGVLYLALEYIDGQELTRLLRGNTPLPLAESFAILGEVADALDYAHERGFVHRDVKPSNILLRRASDGPVVALTDFGIAKLGETHTRLTGSDAIGTIDYMAPEQIVSAAEVDRRADVYALGVVAYQMLTGERPFQGNAAQLVFAHLQKPPPDPREKNPGLPDSVMNALLTALSKKPEDRFPSAGEFAAALRRK